MSNRSTPFDSWSGYSRRDSSLASLVRLSRVEGLTNSSDSWELVHPARTCQAYRDILGSRHPWRHVLRVHAERSIYRAKWRPRARRLEVRSRQIKVDVLNVCRWLFIIDAIVTLPIAVLGFFVLPEEPFTKQRRFWLTDSDILLAQQRLVRIGRKGKTEWSRDTVSASLNDKHAETVRSDASLRLGSHTSFL